MNLLSLYCVHQRHPPFNSKTLLDRTVGSHTVYEVNEKISFFWVGKVDSLCTTQ